MKKIVRLTYNELFKQIKKKSIVFILIFSMIAALVLPFGIKAIKPVSYDENAWEYNEIHFQEAQTELENIKSDKNDKEVVKRIKIALAKARIEGTKAEYDYKKGYDDWRREEFESLQRNINQKEIYKLALEGIDEGELVKNATNIDPDKLESFLKLSKVEREKEVKRLEDEINNSKKILEAEDYVKVVENNIKRQDEFIALFNKRLEEAKKELEKDKENKELQEAVENEKKNIAFEEKQKGINRYRINNKIDFSETNWKNITLKEIEKLESDFRYGMNSEELFNQNQGAMNRKMTYEEYVEQYKISKSEADEKIAKNWYSLENNIPQLQFTKDARSIINGFYDVFVIIAVILVVIIGGGIVATEFSSGTVRLLLIRPVKRGKVLLSKLLSLFVIGFSVVAVCTVLLSISSGIAYGFDTVATPILKYIDGNVVESSFLTYLLSNMAISFSSLIFMIGVVFSVTTLAKNTALAVAVSMILYIGALPLTMIFGMLKMNFIQSTFIPYMNVSILNLAPSFKTMLFENHGMVLNEGFAAIQLILISIVLITISFVVFSKKDIRN